MTQARLRKLQRLGTVFAAILVSAPISLTQTKQTTKQLTARASSKSQWVLTWSDEFNGPNGAPPDPAKWTFNLGGNGWGNQELEYYTSRRENVRQENGNLVIEAIKEPFTGPDGVHRDYTSARIVTEGRFAQKYGRFEARIKLPSGRGIWPAFGFLATISRPPAGPPAAKPTSWKTSAPSLPSITAACTAPATPAVTR